jgi:endo-1,4-beta-mannosidase
MWQAESFDAVTIDRELGFAAGIGFKVIRVFLHPLVWQQDPSSFKTRVDQFLGIASSHGIKTMFAMFDDCWNPEGHLGPQPAPIEGVHNSQWVQSPGEAEFTNSTLFPLYKIYFLDIIGQFSNDSRIYLWDIYNEPGNSGHGTASLPLLRNAFSWARQAEPSQPISSGVGLAFKEIIEYQLTNSDVITFHSYDMPDPTNDTIQSML